MGVLIRRSISRSADSSRGVKNVTVTPLRPALPCAPRERVRETKKTNKKFLPARAPRPVNVGVGVFGRVAHDYEIYFGDVQPVCFLGFRV